MNFVNPPNPPPNCHLWRRYAKHAAHPELGWQEERTMPTYTVSYLDADGTICRSRTVICVDDSQAMWWADGFGAEGTYPTIEVLEGNRLVRKPPLPSIGTTPANRLSVAPEKPNAKATPQ
jgi:hypothetical protein